MQHPKSNDPRSSPSFRFSSPAMAKSPNIRHLSFPSLLLLLFLHLLLPDLPKARSEPIATDPVSYETHAFPSFSDSELNYISTMEDASISQQGALQITPDSLNNPEVYLTNKSGRVYFKDPFKLWEDRNNSLRYVVSFNTTFSFNIYRPNNETPGEGLAFVIAPDIANPPPGSDGGYLGLTNATTNGNSSNNFVAVELDTVREPYDPDDNHVGLNLNSVVSNITNPLSPLNITIAAPGNGTNYTVWIDYNGVARHISVYMAVRGRSKPNFTVLNTTLDISNYVKQWSYFGFSGSTGVTYQLNCVLDWNITVEKLPDHRNHGWWKWYLVGGLVLGALVVAILLILVARSYKRRKRVGLVDRRVLTNKLKSLPGMPREFKFETLKKATDNFDKKMKLGEGGFGEVYMGLLPAENVTVAVKKFSRDSTKGQDDFLAELTIINCLRHKHLVPLLGEFFDCCCSS